MDDSQNPLEKEINFFKEVERHNKTQRILNELLSLSLSDAPLGDIFKQFINLLTSLPWLELEEKGAVFLVDPLHPRLLLQAQKGLSLPLLTSCATVNFGLCLCGRAAESGLVVFTDNVDERHDITYEGMKPHGHYCVPIISSIKKLLGVFTLYTKVGTCRNEESVDTFKAAARVLAAIIIRKQIEKQLVEKQNHLEKAKALAEMASIAKSDFIATMSHELYTPMNGIIGFTNLLIEMQNDSIQKKYLELIKISSERLMRIITQILKYSSLSKREDVLQVERLNLPHLLESTIDFYRNKVDMEKVDVNLSINDRVPTEIVGDKIVLNDVLHILLDNSVQHTEQGCISLSVDVGESADEIRKAADSDSIPLIFTLSDTGAGIAEEKQEIIFDAFTQVDKFLTRKKQGTGLGLAICLKLVELMGGKIWLESEPGKGTTFYFTAQFTET